MRKTCLTFILLATLGSCTKVELPSADAVEEEEEVVNKQQKTIQFVMKGITEEYSTRATIASVGCTDLWVWEGDNLLAHKVSTDSDFDTPAINLTYGSHDLTFVASSSDGQTWVNGVWSTTKVVGDYAKVMSVTVSGGSSASRQVQLVRRSSRLKIQTTDKVPSTVQKIRIVCGTCFGLDAELLGQDATNRDVTVDISSKQGSTYSVFMNTLTESDADEEDTDVLVEFLGASSNVLYHYERTVSMKPNRCVTLSGDFFSGSSNAITIASTDWDNVEVPLFSE